MPEDLSPLNFHSDLGSRHSSFLQSGLFLKTSTNVSMKNLTEFSSGCERRALLPTPTNVAPDHVETHSEELLPVHTTKQENG